MVKQLQNGKGKFAAKLVDSPTSVSGVGTNYSPQIVKLEGYN